MVTVQSVLLADVLRAWVGALLLRELVRAAEQPTTDPAKFAYYQVRCAQLLGPGWYA